MKLKLGKYNGYVEGKFNTISIVTSRKFKVSGGNLTIKSLKDLEL